MAILHKITVGDLLVLQVDADPNGSVAAPKGSLAMDSVNGTVHRNTDGSTTWEAVSGTLAHALAGAGHTASTLADHRRQPGCQQRFSAGAGSQPGWQRALRGHPGEPERQGQRRDAGRLERHAPPELTRHGP